MTEQCLEDNLFIFTDRTILTTPNHYISQWVWNYGDGSEPDTLTRSGDTTHRYTATGTYTVTLTVTEMPGGTQSTWNQTVKVVGVPIVYDTAAVAAACEGELLEVRLPEIDWNGNDPVTGTWLLGGNLFYPQTTPVRATDNGKLLEYIIEVPCGRAANTGVFITVNAKPVVAFIANETYCAGAQIPERTFGTPDVTYQWVQVSGSDDIGLTERSGTDTIPEFEAINTTATPITATFEVTPFKAGCQGETVRFNITVQPRPSVSSGLVAAPVCSGTQFNYTISSYTQGATFSWKRLPGGIPTGTTAHISDWLENDGNTPLTVEYEIVTTAPGCTQSHKDTLEVTVNPRPDVNVWSIPSEFCHGDIAEVYYFQSNVPGTRFNWTQVSPGNIGLTVGGGIDSIPEFVATNTTGAPITVTFEVTPRYVDGSICLGTTRQFSITVYPNFRMTSATDVGEICSEEQFTYIIAANLQNVSYKWERHVIDGIDNGAAIGYDQFIRETLINHTAEPITVSYNITITYGPCEIYETMTVTVNPTVGIDIDPVTEICGLTNQIVIPYTISNEQQDMDITYSIRFDMTGLLAGLYNIFDQPLTGGQIVITLPGVLPDGIYLGELTLQTAQGCQSPPYPFIIQVIENTAIVTQTASVGVCDDEGFTLEVSAVGKALSYQWFKDGEPIAGATLPTYSVDLATEADFGTYYVVINSICGTIISDEIIVGESILKPFIKFGDILTISNAGLNYVGYQWYRDGIAIGEEGQNHYYSTPDGLEPGTYQVYVMYADGTGEMSCPLIVEPVVKAPQIYIYPNPVSSHGEITIDVSNMANSDFEYAKLDIFDMFGKCVLQLRMNSAKQRVPIELAKGVYLLRLTTDQDEMITKKIVVY